MTKQEIIRSFNDFSLPVLEKLYTVGESILTPAETELTSVDFATMVEQVFKSGGLADTYFPEWTDRTKADFGRFLVELFAIFSDKNFFYLNHFARESFGTTAELYSNLLHKAISNGFSPPSNVGAEATFDLVFENGIEVVYERGTIQIGIDGTEDFIFSNKEDFTLPLHSTTPEATTPITFIHGELREITGNFNGRSIIIDDEKIVNESCYLVVATSPFVEVSTFSEGNSTTKHYKVFYNEKGQGEIIFAHNDWGFTPNVGDLFTVSYFVGGGSIGNLPAGTLDKVINCPDRQLISFLQYETTGGTNLLALETLRSQIINKQQHNNKITTRNDLQQILEELDFVHRVKAQPISNFVFVYAVPLVGTLSGSQETAIENYLTDNRMLMGYGLSISYPPEITIIMTLTVEILSNYEKTSIQTQVESVIQNYLDAHENGKFGEGVKRGALSNLILKQVAGTQNVVFTELRKSTGVAGSVNDIQAEEIEIISYTASTITLTISGGE